LSKLSTLQIVNTSVSSLTMVVHWV